MIAAQHTGWDLGSTTHGTLACRPEGRSPSSLLLIIEAVLGLVMSKECRFGTNLVQDCAQSAPCWGWWSWWLIRSWALQMLWLDVCFQRPVGPHLHRGTQPREVEQCVQPCGTLSAVCTV